MSYYSRNAPLRSAPWKDVVLLLDLIYAAGRGDIYGTPVSDPLAQRTGAVLFLCGPGCEAENSNRKASSILFTDGEASRKFYYRKVRSKRPSSVCN